MAEPTWRLHARVFGARPGHPARLVRRVVATSTALRALPPGAASRDQEIAWARTLGAVRRRLRAGAVDPAPAASAAATGEPAAEAVTSALDALDAELTRESWLRLGGS